MNKFNIRNQEMDAHIYSKLIFKVETKVIPKGKIIFQQMVLEHWIAICKKNEPLPLSHTIYI